MARIVSVLCNGNVANLLMKSMHQKYYGWLRNDKRTMALVNRNNVVFIRNVK